MQNDVASAGRQPHRSFTDQCAAAAECAETDARESAFKGKDIRRSTLILVKARYFGGRDGNFAIRSGGSWLTVVRDVAESHPTTAALRYTAAQDDAARRASAALEASRAAFW